MVAPSWAAWGGRAVLSGVGGRAVLGGVGRSRRPGRRGWVVAPSWGWAAWGGRAVLGGVGWSRAVLGGLGRSRRPERVLVAPRGGEAAHSILHTQLTRNCITAIRADHPSRAVNFGSTTLFSNYTESPHLTHSISGDLGRAIPPWSLQPHESDPAALAHDLLLISHVLPQHLDGPGRADRPKRLRRLMAHLMRGNQRKSSEVIRGNQRPS